MKNWKNISSAWITSDSEWYHKVTIDPVTGKNEHLVKYYGGFPVEPIARGTTEKEAWTGVVEVIKGHIAQFQHMLADAMEMLDSDGRPEK